MDPAIIKATIADRIKEFRQARGMTQEDLAGVTELSVVTISNLETAKGMARLETLIAVAEALGVSVVELLRPKAARAQRHAALVAEAREILDALNEKQAGGAVAILKALRDMR